MNPPPKAPDPSTLPREEYHRQQILGPARETALLTNLPGYESLECDRRNLAAANIWLRSIPARWRKATFGAWSRDTAHRDALADMAATWAIDESFRGRSWCFWLSGPTRTGKTHLATATAALRLAYWGGTCLWASGVELGLGLETGTSEGRSMVATAADVGMLLLDELPTNPTHLATVAKVLLVRFNHLRPTIVTTNYQNAARELPAQLVARVREGTALSCVEKWTSQT